jgi:hypothetical protein
MNEHEEPGWRKSSKSGNGGCVEAGQRDGHVLIRDSKLGDTSPVLAVTPTAWDNMLTGIKAGQPE